MTQQEAKDLAAQAHGYTDYDQLETAEISKNERIEGRTLILQTALDIMWAEMIKCKNRSDKHKEFLVELNELVDEEDSDTCSVGEFVMEYFDLWK